MYITHHWEFYLKEGFWVNRLCVRAKNLYFLEALSDAGAGPQITHDNKDSKLKKETFKCF